VSGIEYLDLYQEMLTHQREHSPRILLPDSWSGETQPWDVCHECLITKQITSYEPHSIKRRYAWAVPNENALEVIAKHSPHGVVEIGAGGGYWAMLLQQRGVDVVAFDPVPPPEKSNWHSGRAWTAVHQGSHTTVASYPTRTLLLCWPSYDESWPAQALEIYRGDALIYIGEGPGGCTADDRFHALLGQSPCWHHDDDYNKLSCPDDCPAKVTPLFEEIEDVAIPQWAGLHDRLMVYRRAEAIDG
jgi:hypothetical protein